MLFGLALMIAEAFAPSFGVLGLGGGLAFIIGSIFLMDTTAPGYGISPVLVGTMGLLNLAFFAFVLGAVIQARKRPVVTGNNTMIGTKAVALEAFEIEGKVKTRGEIWQARSPVAVEAEQDLKITGTDGLVLLVTPLKTTEEK
jgi:membrane-bound serine protease (ClpP class)